VGLSETEILANVPLFAGLPQEELARLIGWDASRITIAQPDLLRARAEGA
jgi:hypothetical protein